MLHVHNLYFLSNFAWILTFDEDSGGLWCPREEYDGKNGEKCFEIDVELVLCSFTILTEFGVSNHKCLQ